MRQNDKYCKVDQSSDWRRNKLVLGAADTFRAATVDQLKIWAGRLGAEIVTGSPQSDPVALLIEQSPRQLKLARTFVLLIRLVALDTKNLMNELEKIKRVVAKQIPTRLTKLSLFSATTGQNGLSQAKKFTEAVATPELFFQARWNCQRGRGCCNSAKSWTPCQVRWLGRDRKRSCNFQSWRIRRSHVCVSLEIQKTVGVPCDIRLCRRAFKAFFLLFSSSNWQRQ